MQTPAPATPIQAYPQDGIAQNKPSSNWFPALSVALLSALLFSFASYRVGYVYGQDFPAHIRWAQKLAETGVISLPHYTYQQLVVSLRALLPLNVADFFQAGLAARLAEYSYWIAGYLVIAIFYGLTTVLLYRKLWVYLSTAGSKHPALLSFLLTLGLMFVAPISLFTLADHRMYLGYIGINVFHNPTVIMLKPLALILFWALANCLEGQKSLVNTFWLAVLTIISTLTKPSYSLCLLPVLSLYLLYRWWKKQPLHLAYLGLGLVLPALLVLSYQYWSGYMKASTTWVVLAPLREMHFYAPTGLGWMFLLSILFPLSVLITRFRLTIKSRSLMLAWAAFLVGATMTYLLAEEGRRQYNLNFQWGAQVGLFILFIQSVLFVIQNWKSTQGDNPAFTRSWRDILVGISFALHLLSGLLWYLAETLQPGAWWS